MYMCHLWNDSGDYGGTAKKKDYTVKFILFAAAHVPLYEYENIFTLSQISIFIDEYQIKKVDYQSETKLSDYLNEKKVDARGEQKFVFCWSEEILN